MLCPRRLLKIADWDRFNRCKSLNTGNCWWLVADFQYHSWLLRLAFRHIMIEPQHWMNIHPRHPFVGCYLDSGDKKAGGTHYCWDENVGRGHLQTRSRIRLLGLCRWARCSINRWWCLVIEKLSKVRSIDSYSSLSVVVDEDRVFAHGVVSLWPTCACLTC